MMFLFCETNVVHSYANWLEKMLLVKNGRQLQYTFVDINPFLQPLMANLFNALKFPESEENPYVMKCILRVVGLINFSGDLEIGCVTVLTSILNEVCKNPKNPRFNHYLFESVATLMGRSYERDRGLIASFEEIYFLSYKPFWFRCHEICTICFSVVGSAY